MYLTLPAAVLLLVLRIPVVRIIYGTKDFPWQSTLLTGRMLAMMSIAVVAHAIIQLINRAFYALHNTKLPFVSSIISLVTSVAIAWFLVVYRDMGVVGIAIGLTFGPILQVIFLIYVLSRYLDGFNLQALFAPLAKIIIASSLMGVFLWIPMRLFDEILDTTKTINLIMLTIAASGIGGMVYLWLSSLLRIQQLDAILRLMDKIGNWKKVLYSSEETLETPSEQV